MLAEHAQSPSKCINNMVTHICNPSGSWEVKAGRSECKVIPNHTGNLRTLRTMCDPVSERETSFRRQRLIWVSSLSSVGIGKRRKRTSAYTEEIAFESCDKAYIRGPEGRSALVAKRVATGKAGEEVCSCVCDSVPVPCVMFVDMV